MCTYLQLHNASCKGLLFEHLSVRPFICLSLDLNGLVPAPHTINKGLGLLVCRVEFSEFITLVIRSHVKSRLGLVAPNNESTLYDTIIRLTVNGGAAEDVFARRFEASKETT